MNEQEKKAAATKAGAAKAETKTSDAKTVEAKATQLAQPPPPPAIATPVERDVAPSSAPPPASATTSSTSKQEARGLLIHGKRILVPELTIVGPGDHPSAMMDSRDNEPRKLRDWVRQIIIHTTKGIDVIVDEVAGKGGFAQGVADYWSKSEKGKAQAGGAQIVIDDDGTVWCLCDLAYVVAYHATTSNDWSIGIEMYQKAGGKVTRATMRAAVVLSRFLAGYFGFAYQVPSRKYNGDAITRMKFNGGPDMVGVFGHRDNAWDFVRKTSSRGRGDPGDQIYSMLRDDGAEGFDFEGREDIRTWKDRQKLLNAKGSHLNEDGVAGPQTMHEMRRHGFKTPADIHW